MEWAIRPADADDVEALVTAVWTAFGNRPEERHFAGARKFLEIDRTFVAVEGDRVVGNGGAVSLELTVPGPATVPAAGLTYVGVLPTHRRRGIMTGLMERLAGDARARGEPVSALLASESTIYGRFGFGAAVFGGMVEIDHAHARLRRPVDIAGRLRMLDSDEHLKVLPAIHDRYRRSRPGEVSRTTGWWERRLEDNPSDRGGASGRFAVVWDSEGYVTYRVRQNWEGGTPAHTLVIEDLVATSPDVLAGLWQYCVSVDLVELIKVSGMAVDHPLRWMLADPRRLRTTGFGDVLWVRLLDVAAALAARTYASDAALVVEVVGDGRYRLDGGGGGQAGCRRTDDLADVALGAADLASAYLGGLGFATLARAGLVDERTPGALNRADALFSGGAGPSSGTGF
jgi:predicted acetyltransferase